ncbi:MAG: malonyl-ACP O-methyltransferase BioC [Victivallaceae bacterium]
MPLHFDHTDIRRRFGRSRESYDAAAAVQGEMAAGLAEMLTLASLRQEFDRIFEVGCGSGFLTRELASRFAYRELVLNDLVPECEVLASEFPRARFLPGGIETLKLPAELDLIAANAVLQWLRDPAGLFRRFAAVLNPEGVLAFSVFGPGNFGELRRLTGIGLDYRERESYLAMLEPDFEVLAVHEEKIELFFDSPLAVLRHIKATGVGATGSGRRWTRNKLEQFAADYESLRTADGFPLTYHPILIVAAKS